MLELSRGLFRGEGCDSLDEVYLCRGGDWHQ